ncbi:biotin synthase auxiliary protein BsaP [Saccharothrix hoggarensis]|uniref:Biotin synthase auxiliary protein n=1 Tax=Saccharothrix hoggarensis TaxID=913853 RepID=A0ABW3QY32_9PSEU
MTSGLGAVTYCGYCGKARAEADHSACASRLGVIDPPRFCGECARRMVVQVTPAGWTATCSRHGEITSAR